jgi:acetyl-CoA carboxylase carboxyltransferase component
MSYHDHGYYKTKWSSLKKDEADQMKKQTDNPKLQIISPQKKLHDIQQIINILPEHPMSMYELQEAIQKVLDGE